MNRMPVRSCFSWGCVSQDHRGCLLRTSSPKQDRLLLTEKILGHCLLPGLARPVVKVPLTKVTVGKRQPLSTVPIRESNRIIENVDCPITTEVDWKASKKAIVFLRERQASSPQHQPAASYQDGAAAFSPSRHLQGHRIHVSVFLVLLKNTSATLPYMNMRESIRTLLLTAWTEWYCRATLSSIPGSVQYAEIFENGDFGHFSVSGAHISWASPRLSVSLSLSLSHPLLKCVCLFLCVAFSLRLSRKHTHSQTYNVPIPTHTATYRTTPRLNTQHYTARKVYSIFLLL